MRNFPVINNFSDIEKHIDLNYFYITQKNDYKIVNYRFASKDVFPDITDEHTKMVREFRGIKFDISSGDVICRPFAKFFNVGEREETALDNIDVSKPHKILEKLDGSMIAFFMTNGEPVWGTKMADKEFHNEISEWIKQGNNKDYELFSKAMYNWGYTPIFEWMAPTNRVVIDYGTAPQLILTALRDRVTGEYRDIHKPTGMVLSYLKMYNIPVVGYIEGGLTPEFIEMTKKSPDIEGYVFRFDDGSMYKMKAEAYVQLHYIKSEINSEHKVVALLLNEKLDDIKNMLPADNLETLNNYELSFVNGFHTAVDKTIYQIEDIRRQNISRKDFALTYIQKLESWQVSIIFNTWEIKENLQDIVIKQLKNIVLNQSVKSSKFKELRKSSVFDGVIAWNQLLPEDDE